MSQKTFCLELKMMRDDHPPLHLCKIEIHINRDAKYVLKDVQFEG